METEESKDNNEKNKKYKRYLSLSGGGIKGIVHIGALYALQTLNALNYIEEISGASAGAIIGGLYIIGYSPAELYDFTKLFDFTKIKNIDIKNIDDYGIDNGSKVDYVLKRLIKSKCGKEDMTLKEVYEKFKKKITFTTVCVNDMELIYLSHETHPDLELWLAIRMSSAFPGYFCPILYNGKYYIDGGVLDNYPMKCFFDKLDETIGIFIHSGKSTITKISNPEEYFWQVTKTLLYGFNLQSKKGYEEYTIDIHVENVNILDFDINNETKDILFMIGFQTVLNHQDKLFI